MRTWVTGVVGVVLLGALVLMIGLDLFRHRPAVTVAPQPDPALTVVPPLHDMAPGRIDPQNPSLKPLLEGATVMMLQAQDRQLDIQLTDEQMKRLTEQLSTTVPADVPSPSALVAQYPGLSVIVHTRYGKWAIDLNNPERLSTLAPSTIDGAAWMGWSMPAGLWEEVNGWLPPETSKPGELAYLLRAEKLIEPNHKDSVVYGAERAALIARVLLQGEPTPQKTIDEIQFTLAFVVNGRENPVAVGPDGFAYADQSYFLRDAATLLSANLHAN